jgi:general secretion pathway protein G
MKNPQKRGFTLIEMLIVMVLIGLLAALVGPRLFGRVDTAKVQSAQTQIKLLENAVSIMALEIGGMPPQAAGLTWLTQKPESDPQRSLWKGPYLDGQLPKDPWGNPYSLRVPGLNGREFSVVSLGSDGQPGGVGLAADIASK